MLVVGDAEAANNSVALRLRTNENIGQVPLADFVAVAGRQNASRSQILWPIQAPA
jgi:threonyl-tRNA synthetase